MMSRLPLAMVIFLLFLCSCSNTEKSTVVSSKKPVANAGSNHYTETNVSVTLDASASYDPDAPSNKTILSYRWTIIDKPLGSKARLEDPNIDKAKITADLEGEYIIEVRVTKRNESSTGTDEELSSISDTDVCHVYAVNYNAAPIALILAPEGGLTVRQGEPFQLSGEESFDPEGATLIYQWSDATVYPEGTLETDKLTLAGTDKAILDFATGIGIKGAFDIQLVVSDGKKTSDPVLVTIAITDVEAKNQSPVAVIKPLETQYHVGEIVPLDGTQSYDPDSTEELLIYHWGIVYKPDNSPDVKLAGIEDNGKITYAANTNFTPPTKGLYIISLTVQDSWEYYSAPKIIKIEVSEQE